MPDESSEQVRSVSASCRSAVRTGRNSGPVVENVQVGPMVSKVQSSSFGPGAVAVADLAVVFAAQPGELRSEHVGGQGSGLAVEGVDLVGDGEVLLGKR